LKLVEFDRQLAGTTRRLIFTYFMLSFICRPDIDIDRQGSRRRRTAAAADDNNNN